MPPSWLSKTGGLQYFGNPHAHVNVTSNVTEKCPCFIQKRISCQLRDFDAQIAHITTCYLLFILLAYFRRVNTYDSLDGLFIEIKDELIEKNVAERLWELFDDLLQVVITSIVDILEFRNSVEYEI